MGSVEGYRVYGAPQTAVPGWLGGTCGGGVRAAAVCRQIGKVDFDAASSWTSKETFLWRHTFQQLLARFKSDEDSDAAFTRLASQQALGSLSKALGLFLRFRVGPWIVAQGDAGGLEQQTVNSCIHRLARAEKILLSSIAAVLVG
eukprot:GHRR01037187.1.p1 GENE.GHRR01037187.1~~GHRR01037187.1.p1  ORF type:complete len:145 (+),score=16.18 GHRR01037187.1:436-870(+)